MSLSMAETTPEVEEEVRRYAGLLKQAIRAAGLSVSEVERRLGAGPKALRRIFSGQVDLKLKHVVAILRIIGMSQEEFFAIAARPKQRPYAAPHHPPSATDFLAAFQRAGFRGDMTPLDEVDPASPEEFDRLVEDAVNRVLERRRREGKAEPLGGSPLLKGDSGGEGDL
jgi:transcriptional regulator with XRE-family HTH domain